MCTAHPVHDSCRHGVLAKLGIEEKQNLSKLSNHTLDVVIIMLGTNDSAPCYGLTAGRIAFNCVALIRAVNASLSGPGGSTPKMVLIAPPPLGSLNAEMSLLYSGGQATSRGLAAAYDSIAKRFGISFIDAGKIIKVSAVDGVHLDREDQRKLGQAVADVVTPLL